MPGIGIHLTEYFTILATNTRIRYIVGVFPHHPFVFLCVHIEMSALTTCVPFIFRLLRFITIQL